MTTPSISDLSALREVAEKHPGAQYLAELEASAVIATLRERMNEPFLEGLAYICSAELDVLAAEKARADAAEAERDELRALIAKAAVDRAETRESLFPEMSARIAAERQQATEQTEATISTLTEQLAEARKTIDNAAYLMRLITEWPTASHELTYTNYRGETSVRVLHLVRLWLGATHWHPEPQLLLQAFDNQKDAYRDFAVKDFDIPDARATLSRLEKQEGEA